MRSGTLRFLLLGCVLHLSPAFAAPTKVFLLLGQSNMVGLGQVSELRRDSWRFPDVVIYSAVRGRGPLSQGLELRPGVGGPDSTLFGPEMGIARMLVRRYPKEKLVFVKIAWGGTFLTGQWGDPRSEVYLWYWERLEEAVLRLQDTTLYPDGYEFAGVIWLQGESDASDRAAAIGANRPGVYRAALRTFVLDLLRKPLDANPPRYPVRRIDGALPFVFGLIRSSSWPYGDAIVAEQRAAERLIPVARCVEASLKAQVYVSTDPADVARGFMDSHYTAKGLIEVGTALGSAMVDLLDGTKGRGCSPATSPMHRPVGRD